MLRFVVSHVVAPGVNVLVLPIVVVCRCSLALFIAVVCYRCRQLLFLFAVDGTVCSGGALLFVVVCCCLLMFVAAAVVVCRFMFVVWWLFLVVIRGSVWLFVCDRSCCMLVLRCLVVVSLFCCGCLLSLCVAAVSVFVC